MNNGFLNFSSNPNSLVNQPGNWLADKLVKAVGNRLYNYLPNKWKRVVDSMGDDFVNSWFRTPAGMGTPLPSSAA